MFVSIGPQGRTEAGRVKDASARQPADLEGSGL